MGSTRVVLLTLVFLLSALDTVQGFLGGTKSLSPWKHRLWTGSASHWSNDEYVVRSRGIGLFAANQEVEVTKLNGDKPRRGESSLIPSPSSIEYVPPPLHNILDVNMETRGVIFECTLGRDMGFDAVDGGSKGGAVVGEVLAGSRAEMLGIQAGDKIVATSATAGGNMWTHMSVDGVKSALNTRFVMSSTVRIRFERSLNSIPEEVLDNIMVPYYYTVQVKRPIGLHVTEGENDGGVYVDDMKPDLGAARTRRIEIGDQVVAMSASWGDRMWHVSSIDSFVVGVKMRTDQLLSFRLKRMVSFDVFTGTSARRKRWNKGVSSVSGMGVVGLGDEVEHTSHDHNRFGVDRGVSSGHAGISDDRGGRAGDGTLFVDAFEEAADGDEILQRWRSLREGDKSVRGHGFASTYSAKSANKVMTAALELGRPDIAVQIFEESFGFDLDSDPAMSIVDIIDASDEHAPPVTNSEFIASAGVLGDAPMSFSADDALELNHFVATTAIKAYGRLNKPGKALHVLTWLEEQGGTPDVYLMSALLYVCAKNKLVAEAENIFWNEIPARNLEYTVATTNSLMYMYARTSRPYDALRVYELTISLGIKCTVVTYGVLIKALISSGNNALEQSAYDIFQSLPAMDIVPGVEIYNQFFEHYAQKNDYRQTKQVLKLMSLSKPSVKPDVVSYGYLISCFSDCKKPRSALKMFYQMRRRGIAPDGYCYMGVLKALAYMRDGVSAAQVLTEMENVGVKPDKKHFCMAMFAATIGRQAELAETLFAKYTRVCPDETPDSALCTLLLRALLLQHRWDDADALLERMTQGPSVAQPNLHTLNYLLQYQMMDGRFVDGKKTLYKTLQMIMDQAKTMGVGDGPDEVVGGIKQVRGIFNSIMFALGSYSSRLQRMVKEDREYTVVRFSDILSPAAVAEMDKDGTRSLPPAAIAPSKLPPLQKPSQEAFQFMVEALEDMVAAKFVVYGDFYTELLRALALEGHLPEAERLLVVGKSKMLRSYAHNDAKLAAAEDLVVRLLDKKSVKAN